VTPAQAAKLVGALLSVYPQAQFGQASAGMYERLLADLDFDVATRAVDRLVKSSKWLPTVAEIRAAATDVQHGPRRLGVEAWGDVAAAVRSVGAYRPAPRFPDPLVTECVRLMGWRNLCLGSNDVADRARFVELYDGLQERARVDVVVGAALPPAATVLQLAGGAVRAMR